MRRRRRDIHKAIESLINKDGVPDCSNVDNSVYYCYPTSNSVIYESNWTRLLWNYRNPVFANAQLLDVYLFHADSEAEVWQLQNVSNANRSIAVQVTSNWFDKEPDETFHTLTYYFAIVPSGTTVDGSVSLGPTFKAIQTPAPVVSLLPGLNSSSTASIALQTSSFPTTMPSTVLLQPTEPIAPDKRATGANLSPGAVAGIILASSFFLLILISGVFYATRWYIRQRDDSSDSSTKRGSGGESFKKGMQVLSRGKDIKGKPRTNPNRSTEMQRSSSEALSMGDAAIMADAFRRVLRKPDWLMIRRRDSSGLILNGDDASRPSSAMVENHPEGTFTPGAKKEAQTLMEKELAGEGKGLVPVMSRRKTRVQLGPNQDDPSSPATPQIPETLHKDAA